MKRLIKSVVPEKLIRKMVAAKDCLELTQQNALSFRVQNLRHIEQLSLSALLSDPSIAQQWEKDRATIRSVFGDEDTLEGVNPGDRRALYSLIMGLKPSHVLEVGTHIGASTIHIAMAMKAAGVKGQILSVDILDVNDPVNGSWKRVGMNKPPVAYARDLGCDDLIEFSTGPCIDVMGEAKQKFDFIFLDGDHSARGVYREVSAALPLLKEGGVILLHDYYPGGKPIYESISAISGPYLALARVMNENPQISVLPLGELPWATKMGSNVTTLAMVLRKS